MKIGDVKVGASKGGVMSKKYFRTKKQKQKVLARMIEMAGKHWGKGTLDYTHLHTQERTMCLLGLAREAYQEVMDNPMGCAYNTLGDIADELSLVTLIREKLVAARDPGISDHSPPDDVVLAWNDRDDVTKRKVLALLRQKEAELAS